MKTRNRKRWARLARGLTLIEIMVVITILAIMAAAVAVAVIPQLEEAKRKTAATDIKTIENGLKLYYARKGNYPDTGSGLKALVDMQILENTKDPWGRDYVYMNEGGKPVIISYGRDGQPGGDGPDADISSKDVAPGK
jgi:general secretion pathway protein G